MYCAPECLKEEDPLEQKTYDMLKNCDLFSLAITMACILKWKCEPYDNMVTCESTKTLTNIAEDTLRPHEEKQLHRESAIGY